MGETRDLCEKAAAGGARTTTHECDVADEAQVRAFRDAVARAHGEKLNLLFNNAGIAGGGSFVAGDRAEWERTFGICWGGVYNCTRHFLPMLIASDEAVLVNTSSVNGFWASMGPSIPHTAYSAAKFAVKGFSEALVTDLRINAPHVKVAVVMPGHIGTEIVANTFRMHGDGANAISQIRTRMKQMGMDTDSVSDDTIRQFVQQRATDFRDNAPLSAAGAAKIILDGVRAERWRILVGKDAEALDGMVRAEAENAYEADFARRYQQAGHFGPLIVE